MGWPRPVALATSLLTGVVLAFGGVLAALAPSSGTLLNLALGLAVAPASAVLGVIITRRQPRSPVGALLALVGLALALNAIRDTGWWYLAGRSPRTLPSLDWLAA